MPKALDLKAMAAAHEAFMAKWKAAKKPTVTYPCPHCAGTIERSCPSSKRDHWSSMMSCHLCGESYFFNCRGKGPAEITTVGP